MVPAFWRGNFFILGEDMKVIRADVLGFCGGVRRAVTAAEQALAQNTDGRVYTLGPLIHNPVALNELARRGLHVLVTSAFDSLERQDTVLIRAHGVPPSMESDLRARCKAVINATCPLVTQSQKRAAAFAEKGYTIVFAGDKNHGEVVGIQGYAEEAAAAAGKKCEFLLIRTADEARSLFADGKPVNADGSERRVVLLSQTTFSIKEWEVICTVMQKKIPGIEICSTICPATHERQDALVRLCGLVDGVIVIGGKNSSNTNRLFTTAQKLSPRAALIETADEIPPEFYQMKTVGISAGASTPDSVIDSVEDRLLSQGGESKANAL